MQRIERWFAAAIERCAADFKADCTESVSYLWFEEEDRYVAPSEAVGCFAKSIDTCRSMRGEFLLLLVIPFGVSDGLDVSGETWESADAAEDIGAAEIFVMSSRSILVSPHKFQEFRRPVPVPQCLRSDERVEIASYFRCYSMEPDRSAAEAPFFRFLYIEARFMPNG